MIRTPLVRRSLSLVRAAVLPAATIAVLLSVSPGCGGPTQRGLEARKDANSRFNRANTQIVYDQARQALATGQFETAMVNIDRAIERYPTDCSYYVLRGRILMEQRRMHQAKETLDRAIEIDPKSAEAEYFLGVLSQRCADDASALEHYDRARELDPRNLQFLAACSEMRLARGDPKGARELIETSAASFEYSPVLQQLRASSLAMEGETVRAAQIMEQAMSRDSTDAVMAEDLALAYFDAGEWSECMGVLDQPVMASGRTRPDLVRLRARCLIMTARPTEARDLLLRHMPTGEVPFEHMVTLGYASWAAGDWERLSGCGEKLVASNPRLSEGYLFLGAVERQRGNLRQSEQWLEQACQRGDSRELITRLRSRVQAQLAERGDVAEGG